MTLITEFTRILRWREWVFYPGAGAKGPVGVGLLPHTIKTLFNDKNVIVKEI